MRILALIPARGGSRRLVGKNLLELNGKPLVVWSIEVVKNVPEICDILVSTDDQAILSVCVAAGAYVPWLRPPALATDTATSVDVALHALNWYEHEKGSVDAVLLLQPTSPFRTRATVREGINLFLKHGGSPVVGISPVTDHPMWTLKITENQLKPFIDEGSLNLRSQELPAAYVVNGSFYLIKPKDLRNQRDFIGPKAVPLLINAPQEAVDIDTQWDFSLAQYIAQNLDAKQSD
jgi:CMP-N,N'-diacetyllegionaminic acid synthase